MSYYASPKRLMMVLLLGMATLVGCGERGPAENAGKSIDQTMERAGEKLEEAGDKAGAAMHEAKEKLQDKVER